MQEQYSSKKRLSLTVPNVFIMHRVGLEKDNEKVIVRRLIKFNLSVDSHQVPAWPVLDLSVTFSLIFPFEPICH